jgi:hypothetical protein
VIASFPQRMCRLCSAVLSFRLVLTFSVLKTVSAVIHASNLFDHHRFVGTGMPLKYLPITAHLQRRKRCSENGAKFVSLPWFFEAQ